VTTIRYSGTGMNAFFGQALTAGEAWPRRELSSYTRTINYDQGSASDELAFEQPTFGGQQQNAHVSGDSAWNMGPNGPVPQPAAAEERQLSIWLTPHGFLKGALAAGNAELTESGTDAVITFTALDTYSVTGTIDADNLVTTVATQIPNPVLGDTDLVATYSEYQDFNGVRFPGRIVVTQGGFPVWGLEIGEVTTGVPFDLPVPDQVAGATVPPVQTASASLADGVWHITGGSHHSVLVEFEDFLAIAEAPLDEARSLAVLAEARRLVPDKPVRYVLTTHHHFDHVGGLRTYVAEGATIVTHASNVPYFERTLVAPATLAPDAQGANPRMPTIEGVSDMREITDGTQAIQVYATDGDTHTNEYTLIFLPGPGILVEADAFSPGAPNAPPPASPPPNAVALHDAIQALGLNVRTIAAIHGRGAVPVVELETFIGRR